MRGTRSTEYDELLKHKVTTATAARYFCCRGDRGHLGQLGGARAPRAVGGLIFLCVGLNHVRSWARWPWHFCVRVDVLSSHQPEKASTEHAFFRCFTDNRALQVMGLLSGIGLPRSSVGNILLLEGGEIRRPTLHRQKFTITAPILPHIVVVSGIVNVAVDEALGRSLVS